MLSTRQEDKIRERICDIIQVSINRDAKWVVIGGFLMALADNRVNPRHPEAVVIEIVSWGQGQPCPKECPENSIIVELKDADRYDYSFFDNVTDMMNIRIERAMSNWWPKEK